MLQLSTDATIIFIFFSWNGQIYFNCQKK